MNNQNNSYSFKWGSQQSHILEGLRTLAVGEISNVFLTDITLACEGEYIEAHRLVLSLCSSFFKDLFNCNDRITDKANGVVILGHVSARDLRYILQYMYQGSVEVPREFLDSFLEAGDMLKVEGLVGCSRVTIGLPLSDKSAWNGGSSSSRPSSSSKKQDISSVSRPGSMFSRSSKRHYSSTVSGNDLEVVTVPKSVNLIQDNVKVELSHGAGLNDSGGLMDNYGDAGGGDSDFSDNNESGRLGVCNEVSASGASIVNVSAGSSNNNVKRKMTKKPKLEDSSCSSSDEGDSDDSDSSGSTEDYFDSPPPNNVPRTKRRSFNWKLVETFTNIDEAKAHLRSARSWRLRCVRSNYEGKKYSYDCVVTRACPTKIYLLDELGANPKVSLFTTGEEHSHGGKVKQGLSVELKEKINQLWENGVKRPKKVMWELKQQGLEPNIKQVTSYIQYNLRSKKR